MLARFTPVIMLVMLVMPTSILLANNEDEDAVFHIECPPDVTVDCDAELWDLSIYGWAYVYGYGSPVPAGDPVVYHHLNSCGSGYITRTWTAYDYQNNPHTCTQYIYVGGGGFNEYNIHWPPNYMTDDCNADLDPDDLPYPYDYPTYDDVECSMIMIGYEDMVFNFGGGCLKILRTWKVLDWCTYDPGHPYNGGRWEHTQVLKIKPDGGITLNCPDDVVASAGANCSGTYVSIPPATGTGSCGSAVQITNNSPYATSNGADASGHYPYGTTYVKFFVEDACGNWEACHMKVVVKDMKKPSPICYNGLTANLMMNHDGYYIDLEAEWFNKGSFDNCTPDHKLKFRIEPSRFTCDDLGEQPVKVYVTDLDGNTQYCNTYVIIQDNMGMCPPPDTTTFTLSGSISNLQGNAVADIELELSDQFDMVGQKNTDENGRFRFSGVTNHMDYTILPRGTDDPMLGISTFDLLQLAKHIYNVKELQDEGVLLAADIDQSGDVNVSDLLSLRKLLLNYNSHLPNNKSWRFIPTEVFINHQGELLEMAIDEFWSHQDLYENIADIDFTGIKIGDLNGSIQNLDSDNDRNNPELEVQVEIRGDELIFLSTRSLNLNGMQMELSLTNALVEDVEPAKINLDRGSLHVSDRGTRISWIDPLSFTTVAKGDELFRIKLSRGISNEEVTTRVSDLLPEMYTDGGVIYDVSLNVGEQSPDAIESVENVEQNEVLIYPNPARVGRLLNLISGNNEIERIIVFNSTGQQTMQVANVHSNEYNLNTESLQKGLYLIQVKTKGGDISSHKVILQ